MTAGAVAVPTIMPLRAPVPGQHKSAIDTNTKIELRSETSGSTIYYTINGSKPEPFQTIGPAAKATFKYKGPFRLPSGRRTVKAIAIGVDGIRESHVVSKAFDVDQVEPDFVNAEEDSLGFMNDIPQNFQAKKDVNRFAHKMVSSKEAWAEVQAMKENDSHLAHTVHDGHRRKGPRHVDHRLENTAHRRAAMMDTTNGFSATRTAKYLPPDTSAQAMRLQRETDFMKCIHCFAPRPSDPFARFCNECGNAVPPLPQNRIAPPEPGQMGICVHCKSKVPFNAPNCLICEAPMGPQNQPMASVHLQQKLVCPECFTANPPNMPACVTCEARLGHGKMIMAGAPEPPMLRQGTTMMTCSKCGRVNHPDARFCDWCGAKPKAPGAALPCFKCGASNQPYAQFCGSCGATIQPPQRSEVTSGGISVVLNSDGSGRGAGAQWLPVSLSGRPIATNSVQTQTVGLFFPSGKQLTRREMEEEERLAAERQMRDRKPLLTAVSPGRGFWRKQMDHVCAHLKAHAQNNAEFRSLIGEPRMGRIMSTAVHEDGYELSLTVNFALRNNNDPLVGERAESRNDFLSSYTEGRKSSLTRYPSQESLGSAVSTARSKSGRKRRTVKRTKKEDKLSPEDKKLLREVGKNGEGSVTEIQQLLDEGADPNCQNNEGEPVLHIAVKNKHTDAIPVLIQEGADVNKKGPNKGNTALHEAVSHGNAGLEIIDTLLGCSANSQQKNDKGETAYDLAMKAGFEAVGNKLASNIGQSALDKLVKPKSTPPEMF